MSDGLGAAGAGVLGANGFAAGALGAGVAGAPGAGGVAAGIGVVGANGFWAKPTLGIITQAAKQHAAARFRVNIATRAGRSLGSLGKRSNIVRISARRDEKK